MSLSSSGAQSLNSDTASHKILEYSQQNAFPGGGFNFFLICIVGGGIKVHSTLAT
jgi:hypothetical protein